MKNTPLLGLLFIVFLGLNASIVKAVDIYTFDTPDQQARYLYLTKTLRCPKCQNQDIADSNAPIAADLRREIHRMLLQGKTNDEIVQFMVDRYGEFVVYLPRFDRSTWLLWLGPFGLALTGVFTVFILSRKASSKKLKGDNTALNATETEKLKRLLSEDDN